MSSVSYLGLNRGRDAGENETAKNRNLTAVMESGRSNDGAADGPVRVCSLVLE